MGSCTTKHAVIATLAAELDLPKKGRDLNAGSAHLFDHFPRFPTTAARTYEATTLPCGRHTPFRQHAHHRLHTR
jgi:hypothetical protein